MIYIKYAIINDNKIIKFEYPKTQNDLDVITSTLSEGTKILPVEIKEFSTNHDTEIWDRNPPEFQILNDIVIETHPLKAKNSAFTNLLSKINCMASVAKLTITGDTITLITHTHKLSEAQNLLNNINLGKEKDFPLLSAELNITGSSLKEIAEIIINKSNLWKKSISGIESTRLSARNTVRSYARQVPPDLINAENFVKNLKF